ncbi:diacylglycerol kinase [Amycolatopsis sp. NPDC059021]|uniref:diacylglycerol kinase n=1 Tax=Amycolatopsis sp. NPDC059021 TaxID=3346704 RepID=UPI0036703D17
MKDIRSVVVLTNPAAGAGHADRAARQATRRLRDRGVDVLDVAGGDAEDAFRLAAEAVRQRVDALVVVGGDGMICLALQALTGSDVPLGIVPAGTGNDHARAYGLPTGDPEAAADVIADGHVETVDVGRIEADDGTRRYFGSVLAAGFDSLVNDRANRLRWPRGRARYNLAILAEFANLRPLPFRLTLDNGLVLEQDVLLAAVGNTASYGGGMRICPGADHTDGLLDVTVVRAMPRRTALRFLPTVFAGTHVRHAGVDTYRTASVRLESPGITTYADGEPVAPLPVEVSVLPGALTVLVPRKET